MRKTKFKCIFMSTVMFLNVKELVRTASDELLSEVLKTIPFGGLAKKCIEALIELIISAGKE